MERRRFPAPWQIVDIPGGWKEDANGVSVAYVYGEDGPRGASPPGLPGCPSCSDVSG